MSSVPSKVENEIKKAIWTTGDIILLCIIGWLIYQFIRFLVTRKQPTIYQMFLIEDIFYLLGILFNAFFSLIGSLFEQF